MALDRVDLRDEVSLAAPVSSEWLVVARRRDDLGALAADPRWAPAGADRASIWTDDFSNILGVLQWQ